MVVAFLVGCVGAVAILKNIEPVGLALALAPVWAFMTTFIVAAVDESVRN